MPRVRSLLSFLLLLFGGVNARRMPFTPVSQQVSLIDVPEEKAMLAASEWWDGTAGNLKVQLWTWNSGKADISSEADAIFSQSQADVLVTCQTEAVDSIRKYVRNEDWLMVSYAEHWGMAGGAVNSQILGVFLRQKGASNRLSAWTPPEDSWKIAGTGWGIGGFINDVLMKESTVPKVLTAKTRLHMTSGSGKGGASTDLSWDDTDKVTTFVCAHLDSHSEDKRSSGLVQMLAEVKSPDPAIQQALAADPKRLWSFGKPMDSLLLLGDLNFRLGATALDSALPPDDLRFSPVKGSWQSDSLEARVAQLLRSSKGRKFLSLFDPLNVNVQGQQPSILVRPEGDDGLGFVCNQPYEHYIPTYKMKDREACSELAEELHLPVEIPQQGTVGDSQKVLNAMLRCYGKKNPKMKGQLKFMTKNDGAELQLGWLDRFCFKTAQDSTTRISLTSEEAFPHWHGSDHMATSVMLQMTLEHS